MSGAAQERALGTPTRLVDPFEIHLGPLYEVGSRGSRRFAFRIDARHVDADGLVPPGLFATLADMTLGQAVWDATDSAPSVTLSMQMQFVGTAKLGDVIEVAPEPVRRMGSLVFVRGDFTVAGKAIATAMSSWKLLGRD
jgi:acyl-coenzyme A thioesterase PaaI-like protein